MFHTILLGKPHSGKEDGGQDAGWQTYDEAQLKMYTMLEEVFMARKGIWKSLASTWKVQPAKHALDSTLSRGRLISTLLAQMWLLGWESTCLVMLIERPLQLSSPNNA